MRAIKTLRHMMRSLLASSRVEEELDEELRYHLERQIEVFRAQGLREDEARLQALREFGGLDQRKEECRDARGLGIVETFTQDVRYAWRTLRRTPAFAALGVLVMALGIGANTAIFTLLDQVLLRPLPVHEPDRLVRLRWNGEFNAVAMSDDSLSYSVGWHKRAFCYSCCALLLPREMRRR